MTDPREGVPGNGVAPCPECGAQLAADQRYCLNCGRRCGEPRLDFRRYETDQRAGGTSQTSASTPTPAVPPPDEKPQRDFAPLAAAGGIAVLGLMLLVGVLIGRGDSTASAPTPAPVVRVEGGAGGGDATASEKSDEKGGALNLGSKGKAKGGEKAAKAPPPEAVASDEELEALESQSPQEYSESSAKLPNEIATPGEAPPTDDKAPGGGSKGTAIE